MGQFQPFQHKSFCFNVTAGFEANGDRTGQVPCAVGKFGKYFKWWSCKKCPASYYSDEKGSVACKQCARSETIAILNNILVDMVPTACKFVGTQVLFSSYVVI